MAAPWLARAGKGGALSIGLKHGFRSGLEERVAEQLKAAGVPYEFEKHRLEYVVPARKAKYTCDFILNKRIWVETKGRFVAEDRQKMLLVKEQHPELDIRLLFQRAKTPIYKGSPTTYAKWATDHGFVFADGGRIPDQWIKEAMSQ